MLTRQEVSRHLLECARITVLANPEALQACGRVVGLWRVRTERPNQPLLQCAHGQRGTALNYKRETAKRRRIRERVLASVLVEGEFPGPDPFPLLMGKTQCPRCIGEGRQSYEERTFPYNRDVRGTFDISNIRDWNEVPIAKQTELEQRLM